MLHFPPKRVSPVWSGKAVERFGCAYFMLCPFPGRCCSSCLALNTHLYLFDQPSEKEKKKEPSQPNKFKWSGVEWSWKLKGQKKEKESFWLLSWKGRGILELGTLFLLLWYIRWLSRATFFFSFSFPINSLGIPDETGRVEWSEPFLPFSTPAPTFDFAWSPPFMVMDGLDWN